MFDFLNKNYTNNLKSNPSKDKKIIISVIVYGKRYPEKMYSKSPWIIELNDSEINGYSSISKKLSKKIAISDINQIYVKVTKDYNNAPGKFTTQSLACEFSVKFDGDVYTFICEDLNVIPILFNWLRNNNLKFIDSYNLEKLYKNNNPNKAIEILYKNIESF